MSDTKLLTVKLALDASNYRQQKRNINGGKNHEEVHSNYTSLLLTH